MLSLLCFFCFFSSVYEIRLFLNETDSNPYTLFIGSKMRYVKKNIYIAAFPDVEIVKCALKGRAVIKKIKGMPGDEIHVEGNEVFLEGEYVGSIEESKNPNLFLSSLKETCIPDDSYFLSSDNTLSSFDSRYAEFGLVKKENIRYQLWPIF